MMHALQEQTRAQLTGRSYTSEALPHPYAFNLFPHNSTFTEQGYAEEELKIQEECRRILEAPTLALHATCVRVPVMRAHSLAVNISFEEEMPVERAYSLLRQAPGVEIVEERSANRFAMPSDASFQDSVLCGRIRKDPSYPHTLDLWIVGDQLRKGAALNAVQIVESLYSSPHAKTDVQRHTTPTL
jgi:aspartate-semialdehyde dehydrogenase